MKGILGGLGLFVLALIIHLAWWRIRLPEKRGQALMLVFLVTPLLFLPLAGWFVFSWAELTAVGMLYFSSAAAYVISYAGVEETSPSLAMIRALEVSGERGCLLDDFRMLITDERFFLPRLEALVRSGVLVLDNQGWRLTPRGRRMAQLSLLVSNIFRIQDNAGL